MGALCGKNNAVDHGAAENAVVPSAPSTAHEEKSPRRLGLDDLVDNRLAVADSEALLWINTLVGTVWPRYATALEGILTDQVATQIRDKLPGFMQSSFTLSASIGATPPALAMIHVFKNALPMSDDGPKLMVQLAFCPECQITLKLGLLSAGVSVKKIHLDCMISLNPITYKLPVIGGLTFYLPDVPRFDLDFTGIANIADAPGISRLVRGALEDAVAREIVLPRAKTMHWGEGHVESSGVNTEMMPLGMLRVRVVKCTGIPSTADFSFVGKAKVEPYVRLRLGDKTFDCDVGENGLPLDPKNCDVEFALFDSMQNLTINLYDADNFTCDDRIGHHESLRVIDAIKATRSPLQLKDPVDPSKDAGLLQLNLQWLTAVKGMEGTDGCIIKVAMSEVLVPTGWPTSAHIAKVLVRYGKMEKVALPSPQKEDKRAKAAVHCALEDVRKRLLDHGVSVDVVEKTIQREEEIGIRLVHLQTDMWFEAKELDMGGAIDFSMVATDGSEIASARASFQDLKASTGLRLPGPFWFTSKKFQEQAMADITVTVCGLYPQKA